MFVFVLVPVLVDVCVSFGVGEIDGVGDDEFQ